MVAEALADGQPALRTDPAAQQDPRRAVGPGGQHHGGGAQLAGRRGHPHRSIAGEQDAVDQGVSDDRQVLARSCGIEIGEGGVPANRADRVDRVQDRVVSRRGGEGRVPGRQLLGRDSAHPQLALGPPQVRLERGVAPAVAPLVIVGRCALEHDAGVVRGAAADDPRPQLRTVFTVGFPRVGEGEPAGVEHVLGPAPVRVRPVVGPRLDEADPPAVLAQAGCEDAARRATPDHQDIEAGAIPEPYPSGSMFQLTRKVLSGS